MVKSVVNTKQSFVVLLVCAYAVACAIRDDSQLWLPGIKCFLYKREQQNNRALDMVTGFHVMDEVKHIFVLEGLRDKGITTVWESIPQPEKKGSFDFSHQIVLL